MLKLICVSVLAALAATPASAQSQYYKDCVGSGFTWPWDPVRLSPEVCRYFDALRAGAAGEPGAAAAYLQAKKELEAAAGKPLPLPGMTGAAAAPGGTPAPAPPSWGLDDQRR